MAIFFRRENFLLFCIKTGFSVNNSGVKTQKESKNLIGSERLTKAYSFNALNEYSAGGIADALKSFNVARKRPIIVCVGSDLVLGDSLGPLVGTMLLRKKVDAFIYGTLSYPVTAKEIVCAKSQLKIMHPNCFTVAIDAAVGDFEDVGLVKVANSGLKPGLGVNKNLGTVGDCSIIGVVAGKSLKNYELFNMTRLNLIYTMAEKIAAGIMGFVSSFADSSEFSA